jgi:tetratricopeptide (TPR) repeat protein
LAGVLAVPELERAIELKPDYWPPYVQLSDYYKESGQTALAREMLEKALSHSPGVETLKQRLADLNGSRGKPRKDGSRPRIHRIQTDSSLGSALRAGSFGRHPCRK